MKKLIIAVVIIGGIGAGVWGISSFQLKNAWLDGVKEKAIRGNMVIPVTASGIVEPDQYIQIKSKAGGQVLKIHVVPGQRVKKGEVLVELDPVDENRTVEARQADVNRLESAWEKTKTTLVNYQRDLPWQTLEAKAMLADAQSKYTMAEYNWTKMKEYRGGSVPGMEVAAKQEEVAAKSNFEAAQAAVDRARVGVDRAKSNEEIILKTAQQDVAQAEAGLNQMKKELETAKQRLVETKIISPADAMVYRVDVKQGEMIQSGTASFTGGTPIMTLADTSAMFVMAQVDEADIGMIRDIAPEFAKPGMTRELTAEEVEDYTTRVMKSKETPTSQEVQQAMAVDSVLSGKPVDITVDAYRNESFSGVIERILPEPQNLVNVITFRVRIRLVGKDLEKLLALQADLSFTTKSLENVVLVKNDALFSEGKECFVYVPWRPNDRSPWDEQKRPVRIGSTDGTYTEIVSGLTEGEEVWIERPQKTQREKEASKKS